MNALELLFARLRRLDLGVAVPALLLALAGLILIDSADLKSGRLALTQSSWLGLSLIVALPLMLIPYPRLLRLAPLLYTGGLISLVCVLAMGVVRNGSRRWLMVAGVQFQPSELMKIFAVLMLARMLRLGHQLETPRAYLAPFVVAALPASLIVLQPDLGTSLLFAPLAVAVGLVAGMPLKSLIGLLFLACLALGGAWQVLLEDYQKERIWSTYNLERMTPAQRAGPGYQLEQSLMAVGNGGFFGQGHAEGPRIQSGKLPYQYNDFIFAVVCEEHGLAGATVMLLLYSVLVIAIFRIAYEGRDPAGRILCVGVGTLLGAQALVNMAVTLGIAPTKGLPLPLVSAGGSSLLATISALALVQNVAMHRPRFPISGLAPRA